MKASDNEYPSLLLVEGAAPATPDAGLQRLFMDTADGLLKAKNDAGVVRTVEGGGGGGGGGSAGGLLACTQYNPGVGVEPATSSTAYADVDAANCAVTFVAPDSGSVLIEAIGAMYFAGAMDGAQLALRTGVTNVANSSQLVYGTSTIILNAQLRYTYAFKLTGLTPGDPYTYKLAFAVLTSGQTFALEIGGAAYGAFVMKATAVP